MKWFWLVIGALVIAGGAWFLFSKDVTPTASEEGRVQNESPATTGTSVGIPMAATVIYSGSSFSPSPVTVKKGGTVTFVNQSGGTMWVASAVHPTHEAYAGTTRQEHCAGNGRTEAFDQCTAEAGNYTFTFNKTGSWNYHDHMAPNARGQIVVVE